jgi:hypothetical protein
LLIVQSRSIKKAAVQFLEQPLSRFSLARLPRKKDTGFAEETREKA